MYYKNEWTKLYSNRDIFMVFWSLGSGYGIMFALLSWIWNICGITVDPIFNGSKGVIAVCVGSIIGYIHYSYYKLSIKTEKQQNQHVSFSDNQ